MKYKVLSIAGTAFLIIMFIVESLLVLYNLGCSGITHGNHYFERLPFNWNSIQSLDWIVLTVVMMWYALLLIPWIQYLNIMRKENNLFPTLTGGGSIADVGFTVFNIAMIIGSIMWFIRTGEPDEMGLYADFDSWWRDLLMIIMALMSVVYVPVSLLVILMKDKWNHDVAKVEHSWYWFVAAIPFLALAFFLFQAACP